MSPAFNKKVGSNVGQLQRRDILPCLLHFNKSCSTVWCISDQQNNENALPSGLTMYGLVLPLQKTLHFFQSNSREKEPQGENRTGRKTIVSPPCSSAMLWLDCWSLKLFTAVAVVLYGLVTMACVN